MLLRLLAEDDGDATEDVAKKPAAADAVLNAKGNTGAKKTTTPAIIKPGGDSKTDYIIEWNKEAELAIRYRLDQPKIFDFSLPVGADAIGEDAEDITVTFDDGFKAAVKGLTGAMFKDAAMRKKQKTFGNSNTSLQTICCGWLSEKTEGIKSRCMSKASSSTRSSYGRSRSSWAQRKSCHSKQMA